MKSFFAYPAAVVSGLLLIAALGAAVVDDDARIAWLGAALANLPLPAFILRLLRMRVVRTSDNLPLLLLLSAAGAIVAFRESFMQGSADWPPAAVAAAGVLLLLSYVFWYSRFGRYPSARLAVGGKLPDFELRNLQGETIPASAFRGRPAIFLFYTGNRCPFCAGQVREIAERHAELERLGIALALVSAQPVEDSRKLAADTGVAAPFYADPGAAASAALDAADGEDTLPTVVVVNGNGTILYSDQTDNYRVRPEPDVYVSILKRAGLTTS